MKLRKNDTVTVIKGKDKGKTEKIERVFVKTGKVLVAGVNQFKRHLKSRGQGTVSEIVTISKPLPVSNVALVCPNCKKLTRIGFEIAKGKKIRICKKCKKEV